MIVRPLNFHETCAEFYSENLRRLRTYANQINSLQEVFKLKQNFQKTK